MSLFRVLLFEKHVQLAFYHLRSCFFRQAGFSIATDNLKHDKIYFNFDDVPPCAGV